MLGFSVPTVKSLSLTLQAPGDALRLHQKSSTSQVPPQRPPMCFGSLIFPGSHRRPGGEARFAGGLSHAVQGPWRGDSSKTGKHGPLELRHGNRKTPNGGSSPTLLPPSQPQCPSPRRRASWSPPVERIAKKLWLELWLGSIPRVAAITAERGCPGCPKTAMACSDAAYQECLLKELKLFRDANRVMSEEERRHALRGLNSLVRPRSAPLQALPRISSSPDLVTGSPVRLTGLRSRAEFNGTMGEVLDRDPDAHGQLLVRLFPEGASQKLVWVDPRRLRLEASPLHTRAGKRWLDKPLKHLAHHSFKRAPNGGFFSESTSVPVLMRDERLAARE
eukprot:symbB.v1.2.037922.t1/scaffold5738.1/size24079/2